MRASRPFLSPLHRWGLCLSFKLQPVRFKLGWFEKGKRPHIHTAEKPQQKSGVLQRGELRRAREQAESRPPPPGSGRGHRPPRPARGAAAAALPAAALPAHHPLAPGIPAGWSRWTPWWRPEAAPRGRPGAEAGNRATSTHTWSGPNARRPAAWNLAAASLGNLFGNHPALRQRPTLPTGLPRSQPPRRARVPPLPQNFRFRHQHAPHPVPDCRGLALALGLARPGRGSLNPAEAWRKSSCAQAHYGSAEPVGQLALQGSSCCFCGCGIV